jgi:tetratricopeptide (TPR) repeat protein
MQSPPDNQPAPAPVTKPEDIIALNNHGLELQKQKRFAEALAVFDKILAAAPNIVEVHYNRGNMLGALQRFDEAITAYDWAIALKPDFVSALNNRGWLLQKMKRYNEALASYEQARVGQERRPLRPVETRRRRFR